MYLADLNKKLIDIFEDNIKDQVIFDSFLTQILINDLNNDNIFFYIEDKFVENYVKENFLSFIAMCVKKLLNKELNIKFVSLEKIENFKSDINVSHDKNIVENVIDNSNFDDFLIKNLTFDNLVKSSFNSELFKISDIILNENEPVYNPIFIYSASGLGKTHFLNAIGNELKKQNKKVFYLNPNTFVNIVATSLQEKDSVRLNKYADMLISVDVLLIDDVQTLGNKTKSLEILFNVINELNKKKAQILICADKKPEFLGGFEDRFITRFQNGLTLNIKQPNEKDLMKILKFKIEKQKLKFENWDESSLVFLARNFYKSIRELEGAVNRIKFFSKDTNNIKYTEIVLNNIFNDITLSKKNITPERIIQCVANYYRIKPNEIASKSRRKDLVVARNMVVWLMRKCLEFAYEKIGKYLGGKNHSTIIASYKKIESEIQKSRDIKNAALVIEEKINKIT
ncbi:chromosomal replication initiator protein DnaA [[Mycoplasma] collis]|uniref:chromosomal replication initiator protein DnaA n=1 Tax=[Mycoplasma] collis TaxID=2127 RepID=UPI00068D8930|nr:chromosomal replication initiator protein DnaA [[Mycoplasma] collis]